MYRALKVRHGAETYGIMIVERTDGCFEKEVFMEYVRNAQEA